MIRDVVVAILATSSVVVLGYYLVENAIYFVIHVSGLLGLREEVRETRWGPIYQRFSSPFPPDIAVVVPAYNEAAVIVGSVQSLLNLNYPDVEIVVVNDGSTDDTLERLVDAFELVEVEAEVPLEVPSEEIRAIYRSREAIDLLVVDKANGGKADALNAGVWLTEQPLFCAIDADSIIDRDALRQVARPFLEHPERTIATGGTVFVANASTIEKGEVRSVELPKSVLGQLQVMEYLRAFYSGRLGLTRFRSLLIISGAFGLFRTDVVRNVGGYETESVTEDFELIVRLHRHFRGRDQPYRVDFVPQSIAWTEVPETLGALGRQRRRWFRGLVDTLVRHRRMFASRTYDRIGVFAFPFFVFVEALGPLVEGLGYALVVLAFFVGAVNLQFFLLYVTLAVGIGVFLSWFGVFSEVWSFRRYERTGQIVRLLWSGVLENFGYRQWRAFQAWRGVFEYLRGDTSWGEMTRRGFDEQSTDSER